MQNYRNRIEIYSPSSGTRELLYAAQNDEHVEKYGVRRMVVVDPEITTVELAKKDAERLLKELCVKG